LTIRPGEPRQKASFHIHRALVCWDEVDALQALGCSLDQFPEQPVRVKLNLEMVKDQK